MMQLGSVVHFRECQFLFAIQSSSFLTCVIFSNALTGRRHLNEGWFRSVGVPGMNVNSLCDKSVGPQVCSNAMWELEAHSVLHNHCH